MIKPAAEIHRDSSNIVSVIKGPFIPFYPFLNPDKKLRIFIQNKVTAD